MNIRRINKTTEDLDILGKFLLENFGLEHEMGSLSARDHNFTKALKWATLNIECGAWIAEDPDIGVVGSIGIHRTTHWYSDVPYLVNGWFYVLPAYRRTRVGGMLLQTVKQFAEELKLPLVINVFNMTDTNATIQAMQRMGLKLVGGTFITGE